MKIFEIEKIEKIKIKLAARSAAKPLIDLAARAAGAMRNAQARV
jgi:hypothetical protein